MDATVVSPVRRAGQPRPRADQQPGLALAQAVDRKGRTYPELRQARRCRLVVFGVEVGGRIGPRSPSCDCSPRRGPAKERRGVRTGRSEP